MFDIRKIQEQVIFTAIKNESNEEVAAQITDNQQEDNPTWVKNTMKRLDKAFDSSTVKKSG